MSHHITLLAATLALGLTAATAQAGLPGMPMPHLTWPEAKPAPVLSPSTKSDLTVIQPGQDIK